MRSSLLILLIAFLSSASCAWSQPVIERASACSSSNSRLRLLPASELPIARAVNGRVIHLGDGRPITGAFTELLGSAKEFQLTDSAGRFQFDEVPEGKYRLQVRQLGFNTLNEAISVPLPANFEIEVALGVGSNVVECENERLLASAPPLALLRPDSITVQHGHDDGGQLRHTLVVVPREDWLRIHSRITNIGSTAVSVIRLCRPKATGSVLLQLTSIGTGCYGAYETLASGDSMTVTFSVPLRGLPGRYQVDVHPVDPPTLDASMELDFVAWRP